MPEELQLGIVAQLLVKMRALWGSDWRAKAGARFRRATTVLSDITRQHELTPRNVVDQGIELGRRKLEGKATAEHAHAVKEYREEEAIRIANELQKRTFAMKIEQEQSKVIEMQANAERARAQAEMEKIHYIEAYVELRNKLRANGLIIRLDPMGNPIVCVAPADFNWETLDGPLQKLLQSPPKSSSQ